MLHEAVYQEGIWKTVFYQEDPEELAPVLQNEALRVKYQLVNPQPVVRPEDRMCYFIRFNDSSKKEYDVIFDGINTTDLDLLIRQVGMLVLYHHRR